MSETERPELIAGAQLVEEGVIESLVRRGRIPFFSEGSTGRGTTYQRRTFVWIPPEGARLGDTVEWEIGGGHGFYSPEGKSRGFAQLIDVDPEARERLEARVNAAREALRNPQANP